MTKGSTTLRLAVFLGGFLIFQIQPMLGKALLPWFGGAASVWTVCLLFFQALLLAGYVYAHHTTKLIHLALLAASLAFLPSPAFTPPPGEPTGALLLTLIVTAGIPYFVLAANSPLLQRWSGLENPYRLYAISSFGSLSGLLTYPFLVEPWLSVGLQFAVWRVLFIAFVFLCALKVVRASAARHEKPHAVPRTDLALWTALAAAGAGLLAAATNQISQELGAFPLLWVVPLALYLLTFMIAFSGRQLYNGRIWAPLASIAIPVAAALWVAAGRVPAWIHIAIYTFALTVCLMLVHGELARSRPPAASLTRFYIAVGSGGVLGGAFVALAAPLLFTAYFEFPLLLALCGALVLIHWRKQGEFSSWWPLPPLGRASATAFGFALVVPWFLYDANSGKVLLQSRDFYGAIRVTEWQDAAGRRRVLTHGTTTHGLQFLDEERRLAPTAYYGLQSGVGIGLENRKSRKNGLLKVGVIGLGVGTVAAYARDADLYRFYEISPGVARAAREYFTFLAGAASVPELILGDARLQLSQESPQAYDVLIVDAFSSDSIPMHLLTAECGELYRRHLASDGELLIHITNRTLDLEPVVRGLGRHIGYSAMRIDSPADPARGTHSATWMHLSPGESRSHSRAVLWTDDFSSLWQALK